LPALVELTVSVEVPEPPVMLVGLTVAVRPADGFVVRATFPVKPLTDATVIVAVPVAPALTVRELVLDAMVKSLKLKVAVAVRMIVPSVPDTVTV
jgi:hypothetical protein